MYIKEALTKAQKEEDENPIMKEVNEILDHNITADNLWKASRFLENQHGHIPNDTKSYAPSYDAAYYKQKYGTVYTEATIKKVAETYMLGLGHVRRWTGEVPKSTIPALAMFCEKHDIDMYRNDYIIQDKLHILGPLECFEKGSKIDRDPVLLYYVGDGHYAEIHQWGNDKSLPRWIHARMHQNFLTEFTWRMLMLIALIVPSIVYFHAINAWGLTGMWVSAVIMAIWHLAYLVGNCQENNYASMSARKWANAFCDVNSTTKHL